MTTAPRIVANFKIQYLQFLNEHSQVTHELPEFAKDADILLSLYRQMSLTRALDNKAINLQRTGKMGTYPSSQGQEAVGVGIGYALQPDDVFVPYYRDQACMLMRGVKMSEILTYWGGDERGSHFAKVKEDFPTCVPIATQCLHAAGIAYAMQYRQQKRAVLTICGDGGSSKGDFYEAMNVAGTWHLPLVFVINNNQWAISVPRNKQSACLTLAQKAIAAGFAGIQVDGNDVIAVAQAVSEALNKARNGGGPTLVEAISYRLCDHTTADDATRYCPPEERKAAWKKEPIARLGYYLESQGLWSREQEANLQQALTEEVNTGVEEYLNQPKPKPTDMFDHLYAELPEALLDQRNSLGESA